MLDWLAVTGVACCIACSLVGVMAHVVDHWPAAWTEGVSVSVRCSAGSRSAARSSCEHLDQSATGSIFRSGVQYSEYIPKNRRYAGA